MKPPQGFWTEVDGQPVHVLGDPDMSDETAAALAELVRCAIRAIENGTLGQGKRKPDADDEESSFEANAFRLA